MVDNLAITGVSGKPLILDSTDSDLAPDTSYSLGVSSVFENTTYCNSLNIATYPNKCGYMYSWRTAAAGNDPGVNAVTDVSICPKNWRLPTKDEFGTLRTKLSWGSSGALVISSAWRGLYNRVGSYAMYWSASTFPTGDSAYALYFGISEIRTDYGGGRQYGYAIRCLAR
jgi:hypothetical protein